MTFISHSLNKLRLTFHVMTRQEKRCRYVMIFQNIKNLVGISFLIAIIKCQIHHFLSRIISIVGIILFKNLFVLANVRNLMVLVFFKSPAITAGSMRNVLRW